MDVPLLPTLQYHALGGIELVRGGEAFTVGGQLGWRLTQDRALFAGPAILFAHFSNGSVLNILASLWYELYIRQMPSWGVSLGLLLGPSVTEGTVPVAKDPLAVLFEGSIFKYLDDLSSLRMQFRQGFLAREFVIVVTLGVSFRFGAA